MNEMNLYDQFSNAPQCQLKNNWPKGWSNANNQSEMREIHIKREDGNFNFGNLYSYSPPYQEQQGYLESELKPSLSKNLHLPCNIPNAQQHQLDQGNYFYAAGNHQVPGGEDAINFDSSSNEFYADMNKNGMQQVVHTDELYTGRYPTPPHQQMLTVPINDGSTPSLPPYSLSSTGSAPPSPSVSYDLDIGSQYQNSAFNDPLMSPYSNGQYPPFFDDVMHLASGRGGKDPKYCERRRKNNEASKKSRAKKKEKAKEMESRAQVLEQENRHLRQKYSELEQEVAVYKQLTDKITTCDSQECNTSTFHALQQLRGEQVRANNQFPE